MELLNIFDWFLFFKLSHRFTVIGLFLTKENILRKISAFSHVFISFQKHSTISSLYVVPLVKHWSEPSAARICMCVSENIIGEFTYVSEDVIGELRTFHWKRLVRKFTAWTTSLRLGQQTSRETQASREVWRQSAREYPNRTLDWHQCKSKH